MTVLGLRGKLLLAFAVMTSLTMLCAVTAIYSATRSISLFQQVDDTTLPNLRNAEQLARRSETAIAHIANLPAARTKKELMQLRRGWREIDRTLNATLRALSRNARLPADITVLTEQIKHVRGIRARLDLVVSDVLAIKHQQKNRHEDLLQAGAKIQNVLEPLIAIAGRDSTPLPTPPKDRADLGGDPQSIDPATIEPAAGPSPEETLTNLLQLSRATSGIVNILLSAEQEDRQEHLQLAGRRTQSYAERTRTLLPALDREISSYLRSLIEQIISHGIGAESLPALRQKILTSERQMAALRVNASSLFQRLKSNIDRMIEETSQTFDREQHAFEQAQFQMSALVLTASVSSILASIGIGVFFVQRRVIKPILRLSEAMVSFEQEGVIAEGIGSGRDEIGRLGRAFVDMAHHRRQAEIDLTDRNKRLETANAELARSNQELDDFAYIAAHDLREPVRAIQNHARFLIEDYHDRLEDDGAKRLNRMVDLGHRMDQLMSDLLFYARLGRGEQGMEEVDLKTIITEIEKSLAETLRAKNAHIALDHDLPAISGNRAQIGTVFRNLISNGIKYNDAKDKVISIGLAQVNSADSADQTATFYVRDNGIGIDEVFSEEIFRIFKRLNSEKAYGAGTGAGLSFVKKIVENQGGRIWFESELGEGTTFFLSLKTAQSSN